MRTYRVAIIGSGRMGGLIEDELPVGYPGKPYGHISAYRAVDRTQVVAVANRGAERLTRYQERFGVARTYLDYREMIEREAPDIVSVTTPSFARAEPIVFAAEHGVRGIWAEKGLCASLAEADRVAAAVRGNGVVFNWGTLRRNNLGYLALREAIARGAIGEPRFAAVYFFTDLIKHHPHTIDVAAMLLGDPDASWVEGRLIEPGGLHDPGPRFPQPTYDPIGRRYIPPDGREIADPWVDFFRVGYSNGAEAYFIPRRGPFEVEVHGTEGVASAHEGVGAGDFQIRSQRGGSAEVEHLVLRPVGESASVRMVRDIVEGLDTGRATAVNIDLVMRTTEVQFAVAHSHLNGGARTPVPVKDRSLYIPGG
jgi:predicted dehydrogenase